MTDIWSLGILIYEFNTGHNPWGESDEIMDIYDAITRGKIKFPKGFDKDCMHLICHLLRKNIEKR